MKDNYSAWLVNDKDFKVNWNIEKKIKHFARYGILAPTIHNTQPWKLKIVKNVLYVYPDYSRQLAIADPDKHNLYISLGCLVKNVEVVASSHGYKIAILTKEENKNLKEIKLIFSTGKTGKKLSQLAPFIAKRYSNKLEYSLKPVEKQKINKLLQAGEPDTEILLTDNKAVINQAAELQKYAVQKLPKSFIAEMSSWLKQNNTKDYDGMPGFSVGFKPVQTGVAKLLMPKFGKIKNLVAKRDYKVLESASLVGVVANNSGNVKGWINIGRVYEELCLKAVSLRLSIVPMHTVVENKETAPKIHKLLEIGSQKKAKMFFRIGYASNKPYHSPRRPLEQVTDSEQELVNSINLNIEIKKIKINGYHINFVKVGRGKPLLLLHGGNIGWGQWYKNLPELSKYFTVYAIDLPGGGRSSKIDFSKLIIEKDFIDTVEKFIKQMNLRKVNIIGSSIGGWIALKIGIRNKVSVDKIVTSDSLGFMDYMGASDRLMGIYPFALLLTKTVLKPVRENPEIERFLRGVLNNNKIIISEEFINYFYETMESSHNLLLISKLSSFFGMKKELILINQLPLIKQRTLIIWGKEDKLLPLDKNYPNFKLIPNSEIRIIQNGGHIPSIENSAEFDKIVLEFLRSR